jgi:putative addiction module component (TIGR02574 family)
MLEELLEPLKNLPAADRLALIGLLWDSLEDGDIPVSDAQLAELNRRADAVDSNRDGLRSWPEVRSEIEQQLR